MLDVRKPIGWLFTIYGVMLVVWGMVQPQITHIEGHDISFNLNLIWGALMLAFGILMIVLVYTDKSKA
ncbi:MAG: hypothetical protein JST44_00490 [Cyanobacteria bacterium SZAS LIN-5]|nr:hypothetical protein [Cyanobacteria bacterium SZAS LIN-5]RTL38855.1 MAG: hypothetical protein EKK48_20705 [Candidatus Melainabacteria bacterium]